MLYKQIEKILLNNDYSKENIKRVITKLENDGIDSKEIIMSTTIYERFIGLVYWAVLMIIAMGFFALFAILVNDLPAALYTILFDLIQGVILLPPMHLYFITPKFFKKKCLKRLNNKLKKITKHEKAIIASLDRDYLKIEDNNVKMIYNCVKIINEVKYEGWKKDIIELELLYQEYIEIKINKQLTTAPMLNSRELEIGARIEEINSKLEIIKLEFALKNNSFVKKVYMKITELKNLNYNGVEGHIGLLNNLVTEYILYKKTMPVNEKADFGTDEKLKEAEFEKRYDDICYLIKVYRNKDQNDKILDSMFNIACGVKLDDSAVNLDVGLDNDTTLGLRKKL